MLWSQQVLTAGRRARGRPQLRWRERLHRARTASSTPIARPSTSARAARDRRRRRRGLLDRSHRRAAPDRPAVRRRSTRRVAGPRPDGGGRGGRAIMTTDSVREDRGRRRRRLHASAGWPRAPGCSRRRWPRCWSSSPPTRSPTARRSTRVLRAATRVTFDRVDSDGCTSTNDTVLLLASGASGVTPTHDDLAAAVTDGVRRPRPPARRRRRGREQGHAHRRGERRHRGRRGRLRHARSRVPTCVKCAIHGEDPNWGRILAELGMTDAQRSSPTRSTSRSTACGCAATARPATTATRRHERARGGHHRRPRAPATPSATHLDQRPHRRRTSTRTRRTRHERTVRDA